MSRLQSPSEERLNAGTHVLGAIIAFFAWVVFSLRALERGSWTHFWAESIFCWALFSLFLVSALYHAAMPGKRKVRLQIWDHALIYVLIAGSYTPFCLLALKGLLSWTLLTSIWSIAVLGILFKIRWTGRFTLLSTSLYLLMGWAVIFVYKPIAASISHPGVLWLVCGGIMYTAGVAFYVAKRMRFHHAVWHLFVLAGGVSHVLAVSSLV